MKLNVEVDLTPEELRRALGLPDLTEVHDAYLSQVKTMMKQGVTPDMVETMVKNWMPMGGQGLGLVTDLLGAFAGGKLSGGKTSDAAKKGG
jgi:Family of unknown function (DUF6489)